MSTQTPEPAPDADAAARREPTVGQQLDAALAELVTRQDLNQALQAAVKEIVAAVNRNTEDLRDDLTRAGVPVRTRPRGALGD